MRGKSSIKEEVVSCRIGIDLLGGEAPPLELLKAVLSFSKELDPRVHLTLFGTSELFNQVQLPGTNLLFYSVKEIITMEEAPLAAIRRKKNSSLCTGIRLLKEGVLQAFISSGNTGALIASAKIELPELPHVDRPALMTLLPTKKKELAVLDVGANTSYKAKHLAQFASFGAAYQKTRGIQIPKVGLLNIGSEAKKGTPELQAAYNQLQLLCQRPDPPFIFAGNIEGRDVFHGDIDVLVTDGFTGNVFLKTAEGIAAVIFEELQTSTTEGALAEMRQRLHYTEYPGAILCGVRGIVIKCHGNDTHSQSMIRSITTALGLIRHSFLDQIKEELKKHPITLQNTDIPKVIKKSVDRWD